MTGFVGSAAGAAEARQRAGGTFVDASKKKSHRISEKSFANPFLERSSSCKHDPLKIVLVIILCGSFLMILYSPVTYHYENLPQPSGSRFIDIGWIWERGTSDSRYESASDVNWAHVVGAVEKLDGRKGLSIGLLNFNATEVHKWRQLVPHSDSFVIRLVHAQSSLTWEDLYPEWIDEEELSEVPSCQDLPNPKVPPGSKFDLIAVKLPCNRAKNWARDVARLHLQLAAAKLAANSMNGIHVLFVTNCFPIPNLFACKHLMFRAGDVWLYKPDLQILKEKLELPVGSCELAVPLNAQVRPSSPTPRREAYATILHSANAYVCGAIAAAQSIRLAGSTRDLVILVDESISDHHRGGLEAAGWKIRTIKRIRNPKAERDAYNEWNYSKFRLWQLTEYDKIIFIDADLLILRNIDFLFTMPEITATGNNATFFNSGVMVVEPSNCTFQLLMEHINEIVSYNGGDQGYLNEIFTWWHRIPRHMNFLKHFWVGDEEDIKQKKTRLFGADPPELYVLHYLGTKPWLCYRDYDCNWNNAILHEFASDVAHARWWKVHDSMPEKLQQFCLLRSKQKAAIEWGRRQAEKANYTDGHWKLKIKDKRLTICSEEFCFWESMLWHWGDPNWSNNKKPGKNTPSKLPRKKRTHSHTL